LAKSLEDYEGKLPRILVVNQGLNPYWSKISLGDKLKELAQKYSVKAIDLPGLALAERNYIKQNNLSFSKALEYKKLSILSRQRLVKFLRNTMFEIEQAFSMGDFNSDSTTEVAPLDVAKCEIKSITTPEVALTDSTKKLTTSKSRNKQAKNVVTETTESAAVATVESAS
jgi:hypothetical protein